mmetsp:Transcript_22025/g.60332  ORF Transcript_22025/g.60332 Transcript_22025/m.60332 type:complete len:221 (+) Transcript_22025:461-1123(+)
MCKVTMQVPPADGNVVLRIWSSGKTQVSGCSSEESLYLANCGVQTVIMQLAAAEGTRNILLVSDEALQQLQARLASAGAEVRLTNMSVMGSWDCGFGDVGARLRVDALLPWLQARPEIVDARLLGSKAGDGGASASRFGQVGIYIRRSCVPGLEQDGQEKDMYINFSPAGKCVILGVPSMQVGQVLADMISELLIEAFMCDAPRIREQYQGQPRRPRRGA